MLLLFQASDIVLARPSACVAQASCRSTGSDAGNLVGAVMCGAAIEVDHAAGRSRFGAGLRGSSLDLHAVAQRLPIV